MQFKQVGGIYQSLYKIGIIFIPFQLLHEIGIICIPIWCSIWYSGSLGGFLFLGGFDMGSGVMVFNLVGFRIFCAIKV
jgi:hypothetical protein